MKSKQNKQTIFLCGSICEVYIFFDLHFLSGMRVTHKHVSFAIKDACNMTRFQFELSVWCNIALYYCVNGFGLCHVVLGGVKIDL